jgi:hypothetical protein
LLDLETDGVIEVISFVSQRFLSLGAKGIDRLSRFVHEPLTLGLRLICRRTQERGALLLEGRVLVLELIAHLSGFGLFLVGIRELSGDALFPRVDGIEDRPIEKALQQPHQDEEVEQLRANGEPVDEYGYFPATRAIA